MRVEGLEFRVYTHTKRDTATLTEREKTVRSAPATWENQQNIRQQNMIKDDKKQAEKQPAAVGGKPEKKPGPKRQVWSNAAGNAAQTEDESEEGGEDG